VKSISILATALVSEWNVKQTSLNFDLNLTSQKYICSQIACLALM